MKLTMPTTRLQLMVAKAMKGASCNKMIPLTSLMAIEVKDSKLTIITSDASNFMYVQEDKVDSDDFYVVVYADIFSKLVARLTCEKVTLEYDSVSLAVHGNGNYVMELPLDEEGSAIKYPNPLADFQFLDDSDHHTVIKTEIVKKILNTAKASLATTLEVPCYTGYYVGDEVIATDTCQICSIDTAFFPEPVLISADTMNLLDVMTGESIDAFRRDNYLVFRTANCTVYGKMMDGISDYQVDAIEGLINEPYTSSCKMIKDKLLQLLDRLSLFVGVYDKNGVYLTFTRDGLIISSKQSNSAELVEYTESNNFSDFTCCIDIEMLTAQVKANTSGIIEVHYGLNNALKITSNAVTQIVALLEDDRAEV